MSASILVVEDDADLRGLIEFKLLKRGFEVSLSADGEDALQQLASTDFDIVLLDVMLPKLSGFQVLRQLQETRGSLPGRFIVLTAVNNEEDILQAFNLGVEEYMVKPFSLEVLVARINRVLGNRDQAAGTAPSDSKS